MTAAFVTGLTGQDGPILAEQLSRQGVEVHGLVRAVDDLDGVRRSLPEGVVLHVGDLEDPAGLIDILRTVAPDEVYNLAGISSVAFSWEHPVLTGAVTGLGAAAVFEAAWRVQEDTGRPVRVVQASSAEIFGSPDVAPQDERTPIRPISPYGAAKAYAHHMAGVYRERGLAVATCILFNHESPLRPLPFVTRKITSAAARIAVDGGGSVALGNLDARRDWGWAPEYVDALVRAARHEVADDFVIATGRTHTVADFVSTAFARAGISDWEKHVTVDPRFVRPVEAAEIIGDARKAGRVLGWASSTSFEEVVARMVDHDLALLRGAA
jgi:GDPmannose 4,6-dehydratase